MGATLARIRIHTEKKKIRRSERTTGISCELLTWCRTRDERALEVEH